MMDSVEVINGLIASMKSSVAYLQANEDEYSSPRAKACLESIAKAEEHLASIGIVTEVSDHYANDSKRSICYVYVPGLGVQSEQNGSPVMVEYYQGKWWVRVWADINKGDPTHAIDLTGAMETERSQP